MNGAESLVRTLIAAEVDTCFTNPGTSEMHMVAALDRIPEMRCVLGLFEGVITGAADGYARMSGKPACTLLHLGPGLANGLANLHNANRAHVPIINIVGQHATYHLGLDTPLEADIEGIALPYSKWLRTSRSPSEVGRDAVEAIVAARTAPGSVATLIVPADVSWSEGGRVAALPALPLPPLASAEAIDCAAAMLRSGLRTALILSGSALHGKGLQAAGRIASGTNVVLLASYPFARMERGAGLPPVERIAYVFEQAVEQLKEFRQIILVGSPAPISYFASQYKSTVPTPADCHIHKLVIPGEDFDAALDSLACALSLDRANLLVQKAERPLIPSGDITLAGLAAVVAGLLPENIIVVDESMTSGHGMMSATKGCAPHDWLVNTGGSIGIAMPLAVGAAVACPARPVLCLSADGSGMYTAQALWTMAREGLKITTVIFANRSYGVLKREFSNLGIGEPGARAKDLFEIGRPDLDWVSLAKSMGVPASRATSLSTFAKLLRESFSSDGPALIEVPL
jgi:acetolactate synthase I/II/III large subunit